jgi:hypothetical protein
MTTTAALTHCLMDGLPMEALSKHPSHEDKKALLSPKNEIVSMTAPRKIIGMQCWKVTIPYN